MRLLFVFILFALLPVPVFALHNTTIALNAPTLECSGATSQVILTWTVTDDDGDYFVDRKLPADVSYTQIAGSFPDSDSHQDPVASGTTYNYRIRGVKGPDTKFSNIVTVTSEYCGAVISGMTASCAADGPHINVSWLPASGQVVRYEVERKKEGEAGFSFVANVGTNTSYDDSLNVEGTREYAYRIKTVWQDNTTRTSAESIKKALACPVILSVGSQCLTDTVPGGPKMNLSWNSLLGVQKYQVYRQLPGEPAHSLLADNITSTSFSDDVVTSYPGGYFNTGDISYFIRAIWQTDQKDSSPKNIGIPQCAPYLELTTTCDNVNGIFGFQLTWTATQGATHYNIYRSGLFVTQTNNLFFFDGSPSQATRAYRVDAIAGSAFPSNEVTKSIDCTITTPPVPPPELTRADPFCSAGKSYIQLEWSASENVTSYTVYRTSTSGTDLFSFAANTTSWPDPGVQSGFTYAYSIRATGPGGETAASASRTVTAVSCVPPTVPGISVSTQCVAGGPEVTISWTSNNGNTLRYVVYRSSDGGATFPFVVGTFNQSAPEFSSKTTKDLTASPSATYYYKVAAEGSAGVPPSESAKAPVTTSACAPAAPLLSLANACVSGSPRVNLSWSVSSTTNIDHFEIFRNGSQLPTPLLGPLATGFQDAAVDASTSYTYRVDAVGPTGTRSSSANVSITTNNCAPSGPFAISEPITLACVGPYLETTISWSPSSNATSYNLFRKQVSTGGIVTYSSVTSPFVDTGFGDAISVTPEQYTWQTEAVASGGNTLSPITNPVSAPICAPSKPVVSSLAAYCVAGLSFPVSVDIAWSDTINTTGYKIYRNTTGAGPSDPGDLIATLPGTTFAFTDTNGGIGLEEQKTYFYWVKAVGPTGLETISDSKSVTTPLCVLPTAPQNLAAVFECTGAGGTSPHQARVSWDDSNFASYYQVYRNGVPLLPTISDTNSSFPNTTRYTSFTDSTIAVGTLYIYSVAAFGPGGKSLDPNPVVTLNPAADANGNYCKPSTPAITSLTTACESLVPANTISWSIDNVFNDNEYQIHRNGSVVKTITKGVDPEFSTRTWKDASGLAIETTYTYEVKAIGPPLPTSTALESGFSPSQSVQTLACGVIPGTPVISTTGNQCVLGKPQITIDWTDTLNAILYNIYRNGVLTYARVPSFFTDDGVTFREDFTGANGNPWPIYWVREGVTHTYTIQGNRGRVNRNGNSGRSISYLAGNGMGNLRDFEILSTVMSNGNCANPGHVGRRQDSDSDTYYLTQWTGCSSGDLTWYKLVDGVATELGVFNFGSSDNVDHKMRTRIEQNGAVTDLRVKLWPAVSQEPASWTLEVLGNTEAKLQNASGRVGVSAGLYISDGRVVEFDDFEVRRIPSTVLEDGQSYTYTVAAVGIDTESGPSNPITIIAASCTPADPNLQVSPDCSTGSPALKLQWNPDPSTDYWNVYKKRGGACIPEDTMFTFNSPQTSHIDQDVQSPGITYEYCAVGFGPGGSGPFSASVPATTESCAGLPYDGDPIRMNLLVIAGCSGPSPKMALDWDEDLTGNTISYDVLRKDVTAGGGFVLITSRTAVQTSYTDADPSLQGLRKYQYRVDAIGSGGGTTFAETLVKETLDCANTPPQPSTLSLNIVVSTGDTRAVSLSWTDASNEYDDPDLVDRAGYRLFREGSPNELIVSLRGGDDAFYSYVDNTVEDNRSYNYQVRAYNNNTGPYVDSSNLGGVFSNELLVIVPRARPGRFDMFGSVISGGKVEITWEQAATTAAGGNITYQVYRGATQTFSVAGGTLLCTVLDTDPVDPNVVPLICTDAAPDPSESWYRVVASNAGGVQESNQTRQFLIAIFPGLWREISPF